MMESMKMELFNDGIYGATITPSQHNRANDTLVRYGNRYPGTGVRWPLYYNTFDSEEYFGTMIRDTSVDIQPTAGAAPFVQNTSP
jgi:hypothetical protein